MAAAHCGATVTLAQASLERTGGYQVALTMAISLMKGEAARLGLEVDPLSLVLERKVAADAPGEVSLTYSGLARRPGGAAASESAPSRGSWPGSVRPVTTPSPPPAG